MDFALTSTPNVAWTELPCPFSGGVPLEIESHIIDYNCRQKWKIDAKTVFVVDFEIW